MNKDIPGIDSTDLSAYAFAHMYRAMKQAQQAAIDYAYNLGAPGLAQSEVDVLASDNVWYMRQARTYALVFLAAEMADDSPRKADFQRAIKLVDAMLGEKLIPRQRTKR